MPKKVDHIEQRRALAEAAIAVIDAQGIEAARLRDVAARAAVTTGALTHYFDSRDQVLVAALEAIVERMLAKGGDAAQAIGRPEDLIAFAAAFLPVDSESQREWRVWCAFWGRAMINPALGQAHRRYYAQLVREIAPLLAHLQRRGVIARRPAAPVLADALVAAVDGVGVRATMEPEDWPPERQRALLHTLLSPLLGPDPGRRPPPQGETDA